MHRASGARGEAEPQTRIDTSELERPSGSTCWPLKSGALSPRRCCIFFVRRRSADSCDDRVLRCTHGQSGSSKGSKTTTPGQREAGTDVHSHSVSFFSSSRLLFRLAAASRDRNLLASFRLVIMSLGRRGAQLPVGHRCRARRP